MASVKVYLNGVKDSDRTLKLSLTNVHKCEYEIMTEAMEMGLPEEDKAMLMALGGVLRHLDVQWIERTDNLSSSVSLLMGSESIDDLLTGNLSQEWSVDVVDWGLSENCIIKSVVVSQVGAETEALRCSLNLIIGDFV